MTTATLTRPVSSVSAKEALRILEQAWAYFTPEPRQATELDSPRDHQDAVQLFAYYRPAV
jgi:hypothetical protein